MNSLHEFQMKDFSREPTCLLGDGRLEEGLQSPVKEARGQSLLPNAQENCDERQPCKGTLTVLYLDHIIQICSPLKHPADLLSKLAHT